MCMRLTLSDDDTEETENAVVGVLLCDDGKRASEHGLASEHAECPGKLRTTTLTSRNK
jgi:hypothetical protein